MATEQKRDERQSVSQGTSGANVGPDGFPRMCEHCNEVLGGADRTQAYICPKCGKWVCIGCHKGCKGIRWD